MRTLSGSARHSPTCRACWAANAAASAAAAVEKAAQMPSPVCLKTRPPAPLTACWITSSCRASDTDMWSGWRSQARVLASMSVKRKVSWAVDARAEPPGSTVVRDRCSSPSPDRISPASDQPRPEPSVVKLGWSAWARRSSG